MITSQTIAFIGVAFILTITPGPDTMLVLRSTLARGRWAGIITMIGVVSGLFVHATLSALGLSLLLVQSATLFQIVKWIGAIYLVWLGVSSLLSAIKGAEEHHEEPSSEHNHAYAEGLVTNVLNPKVAIFYLAFLPQFILPEAGSTLWQSLTLGTLHAGMTALWLSIVALFVGIVRHALAQPSVKRSIEGIAGIILIGFGIRLAFERS